ncbi:unnamed protein product [Ectocarpus sp. 6 AP-2014]
MEIEVCFFKKLDLTCDVSRYILLFTGTQGAEQCDGLASEVRFRKQAGFVQRLASIVVKGELPVPQHHWMTTLCVCGVVPLQQTSCVSSLALPSSAPGKVQNHFHSTNPRNLVGIGARSNHFFHHSEGLSLSTRAEIQGHQTRVNGDCIAKKIVRSL